MTVAVGILGVVAGAEAARRYKKINAQADPIICAVGLLASAPCLYLAIMLAQESLVATYVSSVEIFCVWQGFPTPCGLGGVFGIQSAPLSLRQRLGNVTNAGIDSLAAFCTPVFAQL